MADERAVTSEEALCAMAELVVKAPVEIQTLEEAMAVFQYERSCKEPLMPLNKLSEAFSIFLRSNPSRVEFNRVLARCRLTPNMLYDIWKGPNNA